MDRRRGPQQKRWLALIVFASTLNVTHAAQVEWLRQFPKTVNGVSVDGGGNIYIGGPSLAKYNAAGDQLWSEPLPQLATEEEFANAISAGNAGAVYVTGDLVSQSFGVDGAFISKYSEGGDLLWTNQIAGTGYTLSSGVSADKLGNVYVSGRSGPQAFVTKYDMSGAVVWNRSYGSGDNYQATGVSVDGSDDVYVSSYTQDNQFPYNTRAFLSKFDASGYNLWTEQIGSDQQDGALGVSSDISGNAYVAGFAAITNPQVEAAFVTKYDPSGNRLWTQLLIDGWYTYGRRVSVDASGNVFLAGDTPGFTSFLAKYDSGGDLQWNLYLSPPLNSWGSTAVSADDFGNIYVCGATNDRAAFGFFVKVSNTPEPTSFVLATLGAVALCFSQGRFTKKT